MFGGGGAGRGEMMPSASSSGGGGGDEYLPEDEDEESIAERVMALSEMFPESIRKGAGKSVGFVFKGVKKAYSWGRAGTWILFSSAIITIAPVLLEVEKFQMEEMQKMQQRQMLLGPNVARS